MSMAFHSLLRILLMSPVRIIWFAADICGLRFRANIMKAFIGRFGVPSALSVCDVSARCGSSSRAQVSEERRGHDTERLAWHLEVVAAS